MDDSAWRVLTTAIRSGSLLKWAKRTIASVAFLATLFEFLPLSVRLTDRFTHFPVAPLTQENPFPILVLRGRHATVQMIERAEDFGSVQGSCLVPADREEAVLAEIRQQDEGRTIDATWALEIRRLSANRQRIEFFRMGDGFWGGVYEATPNGVTPLYRKLAGPEFAFIFGGVALILNSCCWGCGWLIWRAWRNRRR